jgi:hypothetical protein
MILNAQGGGAARQLGQQFGLDEGQTQSALGALLPSLAGAVQQNTRGIGGLDGLIGALSGGQHARYLEQPELLGEPGTTEDGNGILGHLFGSKEVSREVASRASAQTGIGADVLKQMLPLVASLLMGGLAKQMSRGGGGAAMPGATSFGSPGARGAPAAQGGGLLDMLTPMLDRNQDGSAMDDVLKMAAGFLGRR